MQTSCDHLFCEVCVSPCLACPTCRAPLSNDFKPLRECNRPLLRMMHTLKVWCPYHHESRADRVPATSSTSHKTDGMDEVSPPAKRPRVEYCDWEGSYTDLLAKHLQECGFHLVPCPQGCGESMPRRDLRAHAAVCANSFETCSICGEAVRAGEMAVHRRDKAELHVQLLEAKLDEREGVDKALRAVVTRLSRLEKSTQSLAKQHHVTSVVARGFDEVKEVVRTQHTRQKQLLPQNRKVVWDIKDIPKLLTECPKGEEHKSPTFSLGGFEPFHLSYFPNGHRESAAGKSALYLHGPKNVLVTAKLSINNIVYQFEERDVSQGRGWGDVFVVPSGDAIKIVAELLAIAVQISEEQASPG